MTIYVNIGEAKTRLSELVKAAVRGEEVIVSHAGKPQVQIVPTEQAKREERKRIVERRMTALGMFREQAKGFDLSLEALKADRGDPDARFRRKFEPSD